jgi:hypothetical protein
MISNPIHVEMTINDLLQVIFINCNMTLSPHLFANHLPQLLLESLYRGYKLESFLESFLAGHISTSTCFLSLYPTSVSFLPLFCTHFLLSMCLLQGITSLLSSKTSQYSMHLAETYPIPSPPTLISLTVELNGKNEMQW